MIYIIFLILSFALTYLIKNYYIKKSLFDEVNERSSHTTPTPHGGGIAIALTWFIGLFYLYNIGEIESGLFYAFLVGGVIAVVSFFDDLYELSPRVRLLAQTFVATLGLYFLGGLNEIDLFFFTIENSFLTTIFAILMIIWFINLYNFLDGINGYAGSEALLLSLGGFFLFDDSFLIVLAMATLGFLFWNYNRAKIFMGDVGSTLLGYNVAIITIYYADIESENLWVWLALFAPFWVDATLTLIRRKLNGEKLSTAHKKHFYQRLSQAWSSHTKVTNALILLNIVIFMLVYNIKDIYTVLLLLIPLFYFSIKYIDKKKSFNYRDR